MNRRELEEQYSFFPGTMWRAIDHDIVWRRYKHILDGSQGIADTVMPIALVLQPKVVEARLYVLGDKSISSVFSYPYGMIPADSYMWEIYGYNVEEIERYETEIDMECRIIELLKV